MGTREHKKYKIILIGKEPETGGNQKCVMKQQNPNTMPGYLAYTCRHYISSYLSQIHPLSDSVCDTRGNPKYIRDGNTSELGNLT